MSAKTLEQLQSWKVATPTWTVAPNTGKPINKGRSASPLICSRKLNHLTEWRARHQNNQKAIQQFQETGLPSSATKETLAVSYVASPNQATATSIAIKPTSVPSYTDEPRQEDVEWATNFFSKRKNVNTQATTNPAEQLLINFNFTEFATLMKNIPHSLIIKNWCPVSNNPIVHLILGQTLLPDWARQTFPITIRALSNPVQLINGLKIQAASVDIGRTPLTMSQIEKNNLSSIKTKTDPILFEASDPFFVTANKSIIKYYACMLEVLHAGEYGNDLNQRVSIARQIGKKLGALYEKIFSKLELDEKLVIELRKHINTIIFFPFENMVVNEQKVDSWRKKSLPSIIHDLASNADTEQLLRDYGDH